MPARWLARRLVQRADADTDTVLVAELDRLERRSLRVMQMFGAWGLISSIVFAAISFRLGVLCALASAPFTAWFFAAERWLASGRARRAFDLTTVAVESAIPWTFLAVMAVAQDRAFALASWVPPMLFCAQIVAATVRLRPRTALVAGLLGAAAYVALSFGPLAPLRASPLSATEIAMLVGRPATLLVVGVVGALVSAALLRVYQRAQAAARQNDLFGKYRLRRPLASGGMGTVIEALYCPEGGFERRVAVKRIHAHLAELPEFVDAFRREAELCARLAHPNVVQVLDFGRVGGSWFLAMEYVDGPTLDALMDHLAGGPPLAPPLVAFVARELLAGLDHAHQGARADDGVPLRIVHRDLCPKNILVSSSGQVKISDFGVARALGRSALAHTRVTGHAGYVAPEQASGTPVDVRADLFPVGVVVWELLAGRRLFVRDNEAATLNALMSETVPPPSSIRAGVEAWDAVVAKALERDPERRFESARAMAHALDAIPDAHAETSPRDLAALVRRLQAAHRAPIEAAVAPDGAAPAAAGAT